MLERLQVDLDIVEGEDEMIDLKLSDKVNEAYTMLFAISTFVSPLIGTAMYNVMGMERTCDIIGFVNLGFAVISFFFNMGPFPFSEDRKFKENLEALRKQSPLYQEELEKRKTSVNKDGKSFGPSDLTPASILESKSVFMKKTTRHYMGN